MEQYLVSARKYRPSTFKSVVGQKALSATLKNAVATGRIANSYLFCGPRGVGKTSCARIFAKTINCEHRTPDGEACNECDSCRAFNQGTSLNIIELDAASNNGVDAIRDLVENVQMPPTSGRFRVFIVDEVHMLSTAAFNAFLKTLEEPPSYVVFILATTEKHKILPTILSRCQIYDFARITIQDMIDHLAYVGSQEGITAEPAALNVIARKADGAMRDALSIFDQVAASSRGNITYELALECLNILDYEYYNRLIECFIEGRVLDSWLIYNEIREKGFDSQFFISGLASYFRDLMVASSQATMPLLEASDEVKAKMASISAKCSPQMLYRAMDLLNEADLNYRTASNKQFLVELTLAKLCQPLSPSPDKKPVGGRLEPIKKDTSAASKETPEAPASHIVSEPAPQVYAARASSAPAVHVSQQAAVGPRPLAVGRHGSGPLPTLRINSKPVAEQQAANEPAPPVTVAKRDNAFSDEAFAAAWQSYIASHPRAVILANTMRAAPPVRIEGMRYVTTVENEAQRDMLHANMPDILASLRDTLSNDFIEIQVVVNTGASSPATWTERELIAHFKKKYPGFNNYVDSLQLVLM